MRTFNETEQNFGDVTLLAVRARATNNLNDSSKSDFNVELESILPVYDSGTGIFTPATTANPVWAFVDIARAKYGKALGKDFLDLVRLSQLATDFDAAGIRFDGSFDSSGTVWSAMQAVMNVGRAVPVVIGGKISAVRDVPGVIPTLGFNANNIVAGSMAVTTKIVNHSEHDGLEIEYVDSADWKRKTVVCLIGNDRGSGQNKFDSTDALTEIKLINGACINEALKSIKAITSILKRGSKVQRLASGT